VALQPFPRSRVAKSPLLQQFHSGGVRLLFLVAADQMRADLFQYVNVDLVARAGLRSELVQQLVQLGGLGVGVAKAWRTLSQASLMDELRATAAQIDLIRVPWLMIGEDPSSAPNGGSARGYQQSFAVRQSWLPGPADSGPTVCLCTGALRGTLGSAAHRVRLPLGAPGEVRDAFRRRPFVPSC
jgi:hypothetical protein